MEQTTTDIPGAAVRGTASGVFFMAIFGTLWVDIGIAGLQGWGLPWLIVAGVLVGVALFTGGASLMRASRQLTDQVTAENAQYWKRARRWFRIIFATEGITMGVTSAICGASGHYDLIFPLMAIIVGVHFFPLAPLLRMKTHYITGALLCILAIVTLIFVPARATLDGQQIIAWWTVVGLGSALVLWGTGLVLFFLGRRLLQRGLRQSTQQPVVQSSLA